MFLRSCVSNLHNFQQALQHRTFFAEFSFEELSAFISRSSFAFFISSHHHHLSCYSSQLSQDLLQNSSAKIFYLFELVGGAQHNLKFYIKKWGGDSAYIEVLVKKRGEGFQTLERHNEVKMGRGILIFSIIAFFKSIYHFVFTFIYDCFSSICMHHPQLSIFSTLSIYLSIYLTIWKLVQI